MRFRSTLLCLALLLWLLAPTTAEPSAVGLSNYVRLQRGNVNTLETAIVTLQGPKSQRLDLIAAVHLAEPTYYQQLNSKFRGYQGVLYELILPEAMAGQPLPSKLEGGGALSGMQSTLARSLGLVTQLVQIDYSPTNFIHADLSQEGLSRVMDGRQESILSYFQKAMASNKGPMNLGVSEAELAELDLMAIMAGKPSPKDRKTLKNLLAHTLTSSDGVLASLEDTALVAERNKAALKVLDREVRAGKKKLAIFYGAAHMPGIENQLVQQGWKRAQTTWLPAWHL